MRVIYLLLADGDGTMHSRLDPFGVAVSSEEEAKRFEKEGNVGYMNSYMKIKVFDNMEDAVKSVYP